jgi:hypothetical protein
MKYYVATDLDKYVLSIQHTGTIKDFVELDLDQYDLTEGRLHAYKLGKNKLIFDPARYEEIQYAEQKKKDMKEISTLKSFLYETDYITSRAFEEIMALNNPLTWIADVIKINVKYTKLYASTIAERSWARNRIEELERKYE